MIEKYPVHQNERSAQSVPSPLMSFVEDEIARLEKRLIPISTTGNKNARSLDDEMKLAQFKEYKQQLSQSHPQYDGIAAELQTQQVQYEQRIQSLQQELVPRSSDLAKEAMPGDNAYFAIQESIFHEQRILTKASTVLDQMDKVYIANKIVEYQSRQGQTKRGSILRS